MNGNEIQVSQYKLRGKDVGIFFENKKLRKEIFIYIT
jgi:hypothetical protein